jgi:hypothetical protein
MGAGSREGRVMDRRVAALLAMTRAAWALAREGRVMDRRVAALLAMTRAAWALARGKGE